MKKINRGNSEKGQTMILGVIAVLILLIAILFLFDLHSIIRVKVKTQNAADAAALTAANWQRHSLNLIGELNMVKACTVLVTDLEPFGDDTPDVITEKSELITEMQARVSFVGPMIGFGAAQQAAKNNGMNPVDHYTAVVSQHIDNLENEDYYGSTAGINQEIENYSWRWAYQDMIEAVNSGQGGIAAAPNADFATLPEITPNSWLMDLGLYRAISAEYWCYGTLSSLIQNYPFSGTWWQVSIVENTGRFTEECEYSPIFIEYSAVGDLEPFNLAESTLRAEAPERGMTVSDGYDKTDSNDTDGINYTLPYVKWCIYESSWESTPSSEWTDGLYLRAPLMPDYTYGGAVAKMTCRAEPTVMSSNYKVSGPSGTWLETSTAEVSEVYCSALAKPLGRLAEGIPPYVAKMVLPVFDKSRLIPIAMQDPTGLYDPFNEDQYTLFQFLKWAATVSDIDNPGSSPPAGGAYYLACLQKLNDVEWRSKGFNKSYVSTVPTTRYDPTSNPTGAGWLQMGHTYSYDASGNATAVLTTNEDTCDDWGGGGGGPRAGPSILH